MSDTAEVTLDDIDLDLELLTFAGRASRGLVEVVHRRDLPSPDSECGRALEEVLGGPVVFSTSPSDIVVPWLGLTNNYHAARDHYTDALAVSVKALRQGTITEMVSAVKMELLASNNLALAKRQAITAVKLFADYLRGRGITIEPPK
jgi:hypothetical protein